MADEPSLQTADSRLDGSKDEALEDIVSDEDDVEDLSDVLSDLDGLEEHQPLSPQTTGQVDSGGGCKRAAEEGTASGSTDPAKKIKLPSDMTTTTSSSASSTNELGSVVRRRDATSGDEWVCADCNAVFGKYVDAKTHARSPNHLSVVEGRLPKVHGGGSKSSSSSPSSLHYCFLCWFAFSTSSELTSHYKTTRHVNTLSKLGVVRMHAPSPAPSSSSSSEDMIVLDEVNSDLDQVSSEDEDVHEQQQPPRLAGPDLGLEDVDSDEDSDGLEDVSDCDDPPPPPSIPCAPPPPIISGTSSHHHRLLDNIKPVPATSSSPSVRPVDSAK